MMSEWLDVRRQVLERIVALEALLPEAFAKGQHAYRAELARAVVGAVGVEGLEAAAKHARRLEPLMRSASATASDVQAVLHEIRHEIEIAAPPSPPPMPALGLHILVVDDDPITRKVLRHVLEAAECWVHEWPSAHDVPGAVARNQVDAVLLDLHLADGRGLDACTELRHDAGTRTVPVIVLTGDQEPSAARIAFGAGADDFIVKPVRAGELITRLQHVVRRRARTLGMDALRALSR